MPTSNWCSKAAILVFSLFLLLTGCTEPEQTQTNTNNLLNQAAEQYVKLGLELGEYDKDYVDAYLGPQEWQTNAQENLRTKQQLASDIQQLFNRLKTFDVTAPDAKLRHKALLRNVRAMDVRARMLVGETFSFTQEAQLIYDVVLPSYDFNKFDAALIEIDKLIPGQGDLASRVDDFRDSFVIPEDKVGPAIDLAIAECRKRSSRFISLPENERFTLEYVTNKSWSGYNWYQGDNKSLMQINQDFPMQIDRAITLGCHEGYPGHHVWNVLIENNLLGDKNWIEYAIFPLFSPYALIAEGSANFGVELAFPAQQKVFFEQSVLFPLAGLEATKASDLDRLNLLMGQLSHSITATAELYLNGTISREEAIQQRQKYALVSRQRAEQSLRFIEQYRAYVLNYNLGKDIVAKYINSQSDDQEGKWRAFERMLTELSTASDMLSE